LVELKLHSVSLTLYLFISLYFLFSVSLYLCISVSLYLCISVSLYLSISLSLYLLISLFLYFSISIYFYFSIKYTTDPFLPRFILFPDISFSTFLPGAISSYIDSIFFDHIFLARNFPCSYYFSLFCSLLLFLALIVYLVLSSFGIISFS
jgi:hypothetical protein